MHKHPSLISIQHHFKEFYSVRYS